MRKSASAVHDQAADPHDADIYRILQQSGIPVNSREVQDGIRFGKQKLKEVRRELMRLKQHSGG